MSSRDKIHNNKDFEQLWFLYQTEGVPEEESINSFCEKNGVPYEEFDKWFRKTHQAVGWVEIENIPADEPTLKSSRRRGLKAEPDGETAGRGRKSGVRPDVACIELLA